MKINIVYEDENLIVINKPAGIATQTKKVGQKDVVSELKKYLKGGYVGVIHRLDQPVEGLLVFAKNSQMAAALSKQVQQKGEDIFVKDYIALCCLDESFADNNSESMESVITNMFENKVETILQNYLIKLPEGITKIIDEAQVSTYPEAKQARLKYEIIGKKDKACLVRAHLETGRFHQIRAQLSHAGLPILGDKKYCTPASEELSEELSVGHVLLCADRLKFVHPATKQQMDFEIHSGDIENTFNKVCL